MSKTHLRWEDGTLHALGAVQKSSGIVGSKTWAHTANGATPLLILWDAETGRLLAVIEAFALGQLRTGAMSGVATRWMAAEDADSFAMFGTGRQALTQLAAVAAVRKLQIIRIWGRDEGKREAFAEQVRDLSGAYRVETTTSPVECARSAAILTLATRACEPFLDSKMVDDGAHINAIGAITPEREEFSQDLFSRTDLLVADDPKAALNLSAEFGKYFTENDAPKRVLHPVCEIIGHHRTARSGLSIFKAMGMGVSDVTLGLAVLRKATTRGLGKRHHHPVRAALNLRDI